jgi:hypothetical protein
MTSQSPYIKQTDNAFKVLRDGLNDVATKLKFDNKDKLVKGESDDIRSTKIKKIVDEVSKATDGTERSDSLINALNIIVRRLKMQDKYLLSNKDNEAMRNEKIKKIIETFDNSNVYIEKRVDEILEIMKEPDYTSRDMDGKLDLVKDFVTKQGEEIPRITDIKDDVTVKDGLKDIVEYIKKLTNEQIEDNEGDVITRLFIIKYFFDNYHITVTKK